MLVTPHEARYYYLIDLRVYRSRFCKSCLKVNYSVFFTNVEPPRTNKPESTSTFITYEKTPFYLTRIQRTAMAISSKKSFDRREYFHYRPNKKKQNCPLTGCLKSNYTFERANWTWVHERKLQSRISIDPFDDNVRTTFQPPYSTLSKQFPVSLRNVPRYNRNFWNTQYLRTWRSTAHYESIPVVYK